MQKIFINLDDSGKLTANEQISVYGGLVFLSKEEKDKFITQYRSIINSIKCKYCQQNGPDNCDKNCVEVKSYNINKTDRRRLINYIKKYYVAALIIKNDKVYNHIINNKAARGRFIDYSLRRLIKGIICALISAKRINPNDDLTLVINIDEQTTKSNGYYTLHDGLIEELKYGIENYNYGVTFLPIINGNLEVLLSYQDSGKSYVVQAADLIAGAVRRDAIALYNKNENLDDLLPKLIDYKIILP